jgi:nucleotide-binding universal stress UspA family protein
MKKILCPTDFSDAAQNAVVYAAKFAKATQSQLVLFNVQSILELSAQEIISGESMTEAVSQELENLSQQIARTFKISCYAEVQSSLTSLDKTIRNKAKDFDLVVMGTNGPDDIFQFLTGSHTYKACIKSKVPVLLIPDNCTYSQIDKIAYAFDYLRERKLPMNQLEPWIKRLGSELSVLQVLEEAYSQHVEEEVKELQTISRNLYAEDIKLTFDTIRSYEIAESIHSYILRNQPDMLALCTVHRNLLERFFHNSLIKNISGVASYPVFVFHE